MSKKYKIIAGSLILLTMAFGIMNYYKAQTIFEINNFTGDIKIDKIVYHQNLADSGTIIMIDDDQNKEICDILQGARFRRTSWRAHESQPKRFDVYFGTKQLDGSYYMGYIIYSYPNGKVFNTREHYAAVLGEENRDKNLYQQLERMLLEEE